MTRKALLKCAFSEGHEYAEGIARMRTQLTCESITRRNCTLIMIPLGAKDVWVADPDATTGTNGTKAWP